MQNNVISQMQQYKHTTQKLFMGVMLFFSNFLAYADRTNISVCILVMQNEFHWSESQKGLILSSFFIGYLLTQICGIVMFFNNLGGFLSEKLGGKVVLFSGVALWSCFTLLTPIAAQWSKYSIGYLLAVRIGMGFFEGVNFPAIHHLAGVCYCYCAITIV